MNFVWQQKGWPNATVDRAALKDELVAFKDALLRARRFLRKPQDPEAVARALAQEAVKTSAIEGFVAAVKFIAAKRAYLAKYESAFTERAKKVILRMFEAGEEGVKAGLSASKWMRMAKVSKRSAERDLAELSVVGAVVAVNDGPQTRYQLNCVFSDGAIEPLNEPLNERLVRLVATHPGTQLAYLASVVSQSRATVKRAVAALVKSGKVEHRGSKKTGGYYAVK